MTSAVVIFEVIAALLAVMAAGFALRRMEVLSAAGTRDLGRLVADVTFPALCFRGLAATDLLVLRASIAIPILGFVTHALAAAVGFAMAPLFCRSEARPTFVFAVAIGNWIFLPLPLAKALYGGAGTVTVLLHNVGAQVFLWTFGIVILRGGGLRRESLLTMLRNPGLWATALGLGVSVIRDVPPIHLGAIPTAAGHIGGLTLDWIGSLTIPLVTLSIGAQLAGAATADANASESPRWLTGPVVGAVLGRLVVAPVIVVGLIAAVAKAAPSALPTTPRFIEYLIAVMPVSLSVGALAERYGADAGLAARSIVVSTMLSVAVVPLAQLALSAWGM